MSFLFKIIFHFSIITSKAFWVLWLLRKPVRYFENLLCIWSLICSNSSFSNTFEKVESVLTGRYFSFSLSFPFLKIGVTSDFFNVSGNFPLTRHSLKMLVSFSEKILIGFFKILIGMSSIGDGLLLDRDFIALRMSSLENRVNENEFSSVLYFSLIFIALSSL